MINEGEWVMEVGIGGVEHPASDVPRRVKLLYLAGPRRHSWGPS